MNSRRSMCAQAARGPVLLMVVGVLFVLQQIGVVGFSRSWPLLIIAIGVMKLLERMAIKQTPYHAPNLPPSQQQSNGQRLAQSSFPPQQAARATRYTDFRARASARVQAPANTPGERRGEFGR